MSLGTYVLSSVATFGSCLMAYMLALLVSRPRHVFLFGNRLLILSAIGLTAFSVLDKHAELVPVFVTALLLVYAVHATLITIAPRSISRDILRILSGVASAPAGAVEGLFVERFVIQGKAIPLRMVEQVHLGNIEQCLLGYRITPRGRCVLWLLDGAAKLAGEGS